jgi:glyoxylase I family protein
MKIEHFAWDVAEPEKLAAWYVENLGFKIVRQNLEKAGMHFLTDDTHSVCIEIYRNTSIEKTDLAGMHPLVMHLALVSEDPEADRVRLMAAGATLESVDKFDDGTHLVMLKDPWGVSLQLCKRGVPLL